MPLAKTPNLIVDRIEYPKRMTHPVVVRVLFGNDLLPGVADEQRLEAFRRLKAKVVVDTAIAQHGLRRVWRPVEIGPLCGVDLLADRQCHGRQYWRKRRGRGHRGAERNVGIA